MLLPSLKTFVHMFLTAYSYQNTEDVTDDNQDVVSGAIEAVNASLMSPTNVKDTMQIITNIVNKTVEITGEVNMSQSLLFIGFNFDK